MGAEVSLKAYASGGILEICMIDADMVYIYWRDQWQAATLINKLRMAKITQMKLAHRLYNIKSKFQELWKYFYMN